MSNLLLTMVILLPLVLFGQQDDRGKLLIMFWNMENFFDWKDDGTGDSDNDFSSGGKRRWTMSRFYRKGDLAAKAILWIADKYGQVPDVIGLCEVENRGVLYKWLGNSALRKYGYGVLHYDSSDKRGIDVALLYRKSVFDYVSSSVVVPSDKGEKMRTRDILQACLKSSYNGKEYHFIVNHHPSKFGGGKYSDSRRYVVMESLKSVCDSLISSDDSARVIVMGDFNDIPSAGQFKMLDELLDNKSAGLYRCGKGTIRFRGKWDLIDMFFTDKSTSFVSSMDIVQIPFLMVWDNTFAGFKPMRTYSGPRYIGGVSDHCPVVLTVFGR